MSTKKRAKKSKQRSNVPVIIAVVLGVILAVLAIGGGILFFLRSALDTEAETYVASLEQENEQEIQSVVARINSALSGTSGTTRVFSKQHRLMFVFRNSTGITDSERLPDDFQKGLKSYLVPNGTTTRLTNEAWLAAVKQNGDLSGILSRSLGAVAAQYYAAEQGIIYSGDVLFIIGKNLEEQFSEADLINYCGSLVEFGHVKGAQEASVALFGIELKDLNTWQSRYLLYLHEVPDAKWDEWRASVSNDNTIPYEENSGLLSENSSSQQQLRKLVEQELHNILGARIYEADYDVELLIDENIHRDLQAALDNAMAGTLDVQSDGSTALDGIAIVMNPYTGLVTGFVGGRSVNGTGKDFEFNETSNIGIYRKALELFSTDDYRYNSLVKYTLPNGTEDYMSLRSLLVSNRLDLIDVMPTLDSTVTLEEVANFCLNLYSDDSTGYHFISQIVESGKSNPIYFINNTVRTPRSFEAINVLSLFAGGPAGTLAEMRDEYRSGVAFANMCSTYIVCGLVGTDALGYGISEREKDALDAAVENIVAVAEKYYQAPKEAMDKDGVYTSVFDAVDESNQAIVVALVDEYVEELSGMTIGSKEDRLQFEEFYADDLAVIARYSDVVSADFLNQQIKRIETVRAERAQELLAFVA